VLVLEQAELLTFQELFMESKTSPILNLFHRISEIPRCSKQEGVFRAWLKAWAKEHRFDVDQDSIGNLVIRVPASKGYEDAAPLILQAHMDMVCEKRAASNHDFSKDPIRLVYDDSWLRADGTTLGADNGIGLAIAMALAVEPALSHPPLELLFTVDEETGLTGALGMQADLIRGRTLINIDSEKEGLFTIGSAGGKSTRIRLSLRFSAISPTGALFRLTVAGLRGGHSGFDIAGTGANANKIMARVLDVILRSLDMRIHSLRGGTVHNAIPRSAQAVISCENYLSKELGEIVNRCERAFRLEFGEAEAGLNIKVEAMDPEARQKLPRATYCEDTERVVRLLMAMPSGAIRTSCDNSNQVVTSTNLALMEIDEHALHILTSQRSMTRFGLDGAVALVEAAAGLAGATSTAEDGYPAWQPRRDSPLLKRCQGLYSRMFGCKAATEVVHAGLECAVIGDIHPQMDMISIGPTIENPHSPAERLYLPSLDRVWEFLKALLAQHR
jgi:dipeptidase D